MIDKTVFDLAETGGVDGYKLLSGLIVPRPIGWIGTVRPNGTFNLAPFSFFNLFSVDPPVVAFSGGRRGDLPKDSIAFAEASGEFSVNVVSEELAEAMNTTAGNVGPDTDEFALAGLTAVRGVFTGAPLVAESPANLECRVIRVMDIGESTSRLVMGEVLAVHVRPEVLDGTRIDNDALRAVGRMAGSSYIHTRDRFDIPRPVYQDPPPKP
jgi:flavin reductase (DIM6/NTAB) family NADH-FMN oxidoreductase RutF